MQGLPFALTFRQGLLLAHAFFLPANLIAKAHSRDFRFISLYWHCLGYISLALGYALANVTPCGSSSGSSIANE
jgi:hypothetical protein